MKQSLLRLFVPTRQAIVQHHPLHHTVGGRPTSPQFELHRALRPKCYFRVNTIELRMLAKKMLLPFFERELFVSDIFEGQVIVSANVSTVVPSFATTVFYSSVLIVPSSPRPSFRVSASHPPVQSPPSAPCETRPPRPDVRLCYRISSR